MPWERLRVPAGGRLPQEPLARGVAAIVFRVNAEISRKMLCILAGGRLPQEPLARGVAAIVFRVNAEISRKMLRILAGGNNRPYGKYGKIGTENGRFLRIKTYIAC